MTHPCLRSSWKPSWISWARYEPRPYLLEIVSAGGEQREVHAEGMLHGQFFGTLRNPALFAQAAVDPVLGTVVWPNGADLATEFLRTGMSDVARPS